MLVSEGVRDALATVLIEVSAPACMDPECWLCHGVSRGAHAIHQKHRTRTVYGGATGLIQMKCSECTWTSDVFHQSESVNARYAARKHREEYNA